MKTLKNLILIIVFLPMISMGQELAYERTIEGEMSSGQDIVVANQSYLLAGRKSDDDSSGVTVKINQSGDTLWKKTYNIPGIDAIAQTPDNSFLILASENPQENNSPNVFLNKINSNGSAVWKDTLGGPNGKVAYDIQHIGNDEYVVTGFAFREDLGRGDADVFGMKLTSGGKKMDWVNYYGGGEFEEAITAKKTHDNGLLFAGGTYSFSQKPGETDDLYLIKTNMQGDTLWTFTYGVEGQYDWANDWVRAKNGDMIVTGLKNNSDNESFQDGKVMLIRVSQKGELVWDQSFSMGIGRAEAQSITKIANNNYAITGMTTQQSTSLDAFVIELSGSGDRLWSKTLDFGADQEIDISQKIVSNNQEELLLTGLKNAGRNSNAKAFFAKFKTSATTSLKGNHKKPQPFQYFPNPISPGQSLKIKQRIAKCNQIKEVSLSNSLGQTLLEASFERKKVLSIPDNLEPGMYYLKITNKNQQPTTHKLIIR